KVQQQAGPFISDLLDRYTLDQYDLVGFTSMFAQNLASFALARRIKIKNQNVIVIMGGANCETPMGQELVTNVSAIDYVFSGPALKSFPAFVQHCIGGEREKCQEIPGVFSKDNASSIEGRAAIGEELDINETIPLDYDSFMKLIEERYPGQNL